MKKRKDKQVQEASSSGITLIDLVADDNLGSKRRRRGEPDQARPKHKVILLEAPEPHHTGKLTQAPPKSRPKLKKPIPDVVLVDDPFELKPPPADARECYYELCVHRLSLDFPRATMGSVRRVLKQHHRRLGPAYETMQRLYEAALERERVKQVKPAADLEVFKLNKTARSSTYTPRDKCPVFERELAAVRARFSEQKPAPVCQDIECGCCFSETPFEELAQCADGHLFCFNCLKRHVEEAAFGGGQANFSLPCMDTAGCTEFFPWSEVSRALSAELLEKYERRLAEDSVARAKIDGLVYCPFCNFPCELDPGFRVLECPNTSCGKTSCLKCKEPSHLPLECHEVERSSETSLRRHIEELMTKAYIRECVACKAELVKLDGCNKIICRCRQTMCYICRKAITNNYSHFCQHPREPGKACTKCKKCGLWDQEQSEEVVQAAKAAAVEEAARQEPGIASRKIGPDEEHQQQQQLQQQQQRQLQRQQQRQAQAFRLPPEVLERYNMRNRAVHPL